MAASLQSPGHRFRHATVRDVGPPTNQPAEAYQNRIGGASPLTILQAMTFQAPTFDKIDWIGFAASAAQRIFGRWRADFSLSYRQSASNRPGTTSCAVPATARAPLAFSPVQTFCFEGKTAKRHLVRIDLGRPAVAHLSARLNEPA